MTSSSASGVDLEGLVRVDGRAHVALPPPASGTATVLPCGTGTPPAPGMPGWRSRPSPWIDVARASGAVGAQPPEQVADDVAARGRDRQGQDRSEQARQRTADDDREDDGGRVELGRVALDLRDQEVVLDLLDQRVQDERGDDRLDARPSPRCSTAGMAEMIGPMIGTSSRTPAITDSRIAYRPKIGIDEVAQDRQADEREDADREAEDQLRPDPLSEDPPDDPQHRPACRTARPPAAPDRTGAVERDPVLEQVEDPDRQDHVAEDRAEQAAGPGDERQQERQVERRAPRSPLCDCRR